MANYQRHQKTQTSPHKCVTHHANMCHKLMNNTNLIMLLCNKYFQKSLPEKGI